MLVNLSSRPQESCMSVFNAKASTGDGRKKEKLKDQVVHHIWPENDRDTVLNKELRKVILWHPYLHCGTHVLTFEHTNAQSCSKYFSSNFAYMWYMSIISESRKQM